MTYRFQQPQVTQQLALGAASVASNAFGPQTWAIRVVATGNCHINIGPAGAQATATATETAGAVTAVNVTNGGSYTTPPTVTFSGGGATTQATGTAVLTNGVVTSITINTGGAGYTSNPTVTLSAPGPVATATNAFVAANQKPEYIRVSPGDKIAVIQDGSATGDLYVTELSQ